MEGFFYDRLVEPSDTTRGLWVDGVWWWTPGTAPIEQPRVDGLLLVADGRWVGPHSRTNQTLRTGSTIVRDLRFTQDA